MEIKPQQDTFQINIEEDGTVTIVTGKMAAEIHRTAEEFLKDVIRALGGNATVKHLDKQHVHYHSHGHNHAHVHA